MATMYIAERIVKENAQNKSTKVGTGKILFMLNDFKEGDKIIFEASLTYQIMKCGVIQDESFFYIHKRRLCTLQNATSTNGDYVHCRTPLPQTGTM